MLEELKTLKNEIELQFNNLSDHNWVAGQLKHLQGKHEILTNVITKLEQESNNAPSAEEKPTENSDDSQREQDVPGTPEGQVSAEPVGSGN